MSDKLDSWIERHPLLSNILGLVIYAGAQFVMFGMIFLMAQGIASDIVNPS